MIFCTLKQLTENAWAHLDPIKPHLDVATVGTFAVSLLGFMPSVVTWITTLTTLAWSCIRLYEMPTVQKWLARRRASKQEIVP